MATKMQQLIDTATPYWDAEAEIAKRFYKKAKREDHAFYLRAQLWKELNPVDGFFNGLHRELTEAVEMFPKVGKTIDRHDYYFLLEQLVAEYNHFVMLADVLEYVQGRKISKRDLKQLPQEKKLGDIRRNYVKTGGAIGKAAVGITEGGGTALFRVGKNLKGSRINQMTAKVMKVIWEDEKDHYMVQADIAAKMIKNKADMKKMQEAMVDVSLQRVWMRNEMFLNPMTTDEVESYIARRTRAIANRS
ncbi:MAG: hypothetical protein CMM52_14995 [Rhodospirillaceae bacterium]|nr:hypothetical protein [Rhodospirillaceae bacterium]|tara:strand:- start:1111 stop:1851 length:741 start_codon:yes stop_codon:yes gene_type:complete